MASKCKQGTKTSALRVPLGHFAILATLLTADFSCDRCLLGCQEHQEHPALLFSYSNPEHRYNS